ncbi:MAG TPA: saccharopine dehydrogenase NADP-binding domain-containing protein [Bacteroidota bacterium]
MKALLLGCGEMGEETLKDLYHYGKLDEIVVGTRSSEHALRAARALQGGHSRVSPVRVDAADEEAVAHLMRGMDVAVNCVGPNYRFELPIARAAIAARVNLVDINDEYEITLKMLDLHDAACAAGITIVLGLGGSPGINNVLVRAAANQLDDVHEIHTSWVMSGADPGGPALSRHLLYSLSGPGFTYCQGKFVTIQSFRDGCERQLFPEPVGPQDVYHIGHPEPIMLARSFPGAAVIDDKATFIPAFINDEIVRLGALVRQGTGPNRVAGRDMDVMEEAAGELHRKCKALVGVTRHAALRIHVRGVKRKRVTDIHFSSAGRLGPATGIPASVGALMLLEGKISRRGVLPPEECIDPDDFLYEMLNRRNVSTLNGWVEEH